MSAIDIIILSIIGVWVVVSVVYIAVRLKKGRCVGCSGCDGRCEKCKECRNK